MDHKNDRYTYRITWSDDDREYIGLCLEFPSLSWLAKEPDDAFQGIRRVVSDAIADMARNGEVPPTPLSTRPYSGKFVVRVPPAVHRQLAMKAAEEGVSLNRLINAKLGA